MNETGATRSRTRRIIVLAALLGVICVGGAATIYWLERPAASDAAADEEPPPEKWHPISDPKDYIEAAFTLKNDLAPVYSVTFAPDGRLVSTSGDAKLWDVDRKKVERTFEHAGRVLRAAVSDDGATLVTTGDQGLRIWPLKGGQPIKGQVQGKATALALAPDGERVATGTHDGRVREWRLRDGSLIREMAHGKGRIQALAYTTDGVTLVSCGLDHKIRIYVGAESAPRHTLEGHRGPINHIELSHDDRFIYSASDDKRIGVWDLAKGELIRWIEDATDEIWALALSPDDKTLVTGGKNDVIEIWDAASGRQTKRYSALMGGVFSLAFSPDGRRYAASGRDDAIDVWYAPNAIWRAQMPSADWQPKPAPAPATESDRKCARADALIDAWGGRMEQLRDADSILRQVLATDPNHALAHALLGRLAIKRGYIRGTQFQPAALEEGLEHAERAIAIDPKLARAYLVKGWALRHQKRFGEAREAALKAASLNPTSAKCHLLLGEIDEQEDQHDAALAHAKAALEVAETESDLTGAYELAGDVYASLRVFDAAEDTYKAQLVLDPDDAWLLGNYARFLIRRRQYSRAIELAHSSLEKMDYPMGHLILADAYADHAYFLFRQGEVADAQKDVAAAFEASNASADAYYVRGVMRLEVDKDRSGARRDLEQALALEPGYRAAKEALEKLDE